MGDKEKKIDSLLQDVLANKKVPILVLDQRWYKLFEPESKPAAIWQLEAELTALLKEQGKLVYEIKDLKKVKNQIMDGIVAGMGKTNTADKEEKIKKKQQELLVETKELIEKKSDELMALPYKIKEKNKELLILGMRIAYSELSLIEAETEILTLEIKGLREELEQKAAHKTELEGRINNYYALLHGLLGPEVIELFDKEK